MGPTNPNQLPRDRPLEFSVNAVLGNFSYSEIAAAGKAREEALAAEPAGAENVTDTTPASGAGQWWEWFESMTPQATPTSRAPGHEAAAGGLAGIPFPDIFHSGYNPFAEVEEAPATPSSQDAVTLCAVGVEGVGGGEGLGDGSARTPRSGDELTI